MLMPKRVKYRKQQRGRMTGKAHRGSTIAFGTYGLQALEPHYLTRQIEAARRGSALHRRGSKLDQVFPDKPWTSRPQRPAWARASSVEHWVAVVKPGRIILEMAGVPKETAREALRLASHKLPLKTQFLMREE